MKYQRRITLPGRILAGLSCLLLVCVSSVALSQDTLEWVTLGSDYAHTRYLPADEITPQNFTELEEAWVWDGASFNSASGRSTPSFVDGKIITVAGPRRYVVALDARSGETLWSYVEPKTFRWEYSMRKDYGKGVTIGEVNGRKVVYITSPAFFLTALDLETGHPLEGFGSPVPIDGFPDTGVVDLLADLGHPYDPYNGIPLETGYITASSPPIIVNGTIIVGNSAEQGYNQSRIENIPGDILAYDAATGEFKWKFNVIPRPGEYGHETWENDAWQWTGDVSSWAPLSADQELGLVFIPTNSATVDFFGGFRPGDNLFAASLLALHAETGERAWHFQMIHHDIWNYDTPTAPVLLDVNIDGRDVPIVAQATKQAFVYAFNRATGEPLWPIVERPVPASRVPGEKLATTQPVPTKPAPFDLQGLSVDDLVDFTPELRQRAIEAVADFEIGPMFTAPLHYDNDLGKRAALWCPGGGGGTNIGGPAAADPDNGILFVTSSTGCTARILGPGAEADTRWAQPTGSTFADYAVVRSTSPSRIDGIPITKPPYSRIVAIDMNTGDNLWTIPVGETPDAIANNPLLAGVDIGNTGSGAKATMVVTENMLIYSGRTGDGTPHLFAVDKLTGEELARVEAPGISRYGMMTYVLDGHQYVMLQTGPTLTTMALPGTYAPGGGDH
ncbi:MAG: hypothetical protein QGG67_08655 [Gammaproteobacteria bacterium]|nr:hypothetical protein [Gammaproteobacteria bacterium]